MNDATPAEHSPGSAGALTGATATDASAVPHPPKTPDAPDAPHTTEGDAGETPRDTAAQARDIAEVPAVEVITTVAVHLMSSAAVNLGLAEDGQRHKDLDEARKLITALAGLVTASASEIGSYHAAPLRDGLKSLQLAFREESAVPDEPGRGPGERLTGPVHG